MDQAMDSASNAPARRWLCAIVGVAACLGQSGCAKLRSYGQATPVMLGAAAPFKKSKGGQPGGDAYAQEVGRGVARSRELLARDRAEKARAMGGQGRPQTLMARSRGDSAEGQAQGAPSVGVALQAPVSIAQRAPAGAAAPAAGAGANGSDLPPLPGLDGDGDGDNAKAEPAADFATVIADAKARLETLASYQVPIKRQERVGKTLMPAEEFVLSLRRNPRAVRLEWPEGPSKGREVIYSATAHDGLMHVKMPESIVPVPPLALAPDSPMVMRSSRHPITEAGFDAIIEGLEKTASQSAAGDASLGKLTYGGLENPGQLARPSHKLVRVTPSGETWLVYIDPSSKLPVMVQGTDAGGELLERYLFGEAKLNLDELASDDAFDPEKRWGPSGGLFSRLARAGANKPDREPATR